MVDDIPVDASVAELTQAQRQLVEIAKVLTLQGSRVLVFDEPTAALSADDAARLFTAIRSLAAQGIAVIFVSHRYQEVLELCDHVTVLRNGQVVHHGTADGHDRRSDGRTDARSTSRVGVRPHLASARRQRRRARRRRPADVAGLAGPLTFSVRRGEIVALYGSMGSGHAEVARVICGDTRADAGEIDVDDQPISHTAIAYDAPPRASASCPTTAWTTPCSPSSPPAPTSVLPRHGRHDRSRYWPLLSARREREQVVAASGKVQVSRDRAAPRRACPERRKPAEGRLCPLADA